MTEIIFQLRMRPRQGNYTPELEGQTQVSGGRLALCLSSLWETRMN